MCVSRGFVSQCEDMATWIYFAVWRYVDTLQHAATHCNTLQHISSHCETNPRRYFFFISHCRDMRSPLCLLHARECVCVCVYVYVRSAELWNQRRFTVCPVKKTVYYSQYALWNHQFISQYEDVKSMYIHSEINSLLFTVRTVKQSVYSTVWKY